MSEEKKTELKNEDLARVAGGWESEHNVPDVGSWYSRRCVRKDLSSEYPTCAVFRCISVSNRIEAAFEQYEQIVKPEGIVLTYVQNIQGDPADFSKILDPNIWPVW